MLSKDDRRELELIADHLRQEDPAFVRAMTEGHPRQSLGDRHWWLLVAGLSGLLVLLVGLVTQAVLALVLAALALGWVAIGYRRRHATEDRPEPT